MTRYAGFCWGSRHYGVDMRLLVWLTVALWLTWANVYAVDRPPAGGTIPPSDLPPVEEPGMYRVWCPVHAVEGFVSDGT